ncbi:Hypothetical predicted protein [Paramuricea clavata]|uniref:Uncharacterized protein n=1 Tax=Paramuricea clavata TaxID=317549 RepID=A0A6S7K2K9_PARCT|nr:Hypothetical predicted protein [Paramuricea clavata]
MRKPQQEHASKPLVVILGWSDCKPKHLEKYSNIFEAKGWSTTSLPAKSFNTFFRSGTEVKKIGMYIAEVIKDQTQKDQPVFFCPVKPTIESVGHAQILLTEHMKNPVLRPLVWYTLGFVLSLLVKIDPTLQRFFDDLAKIPIACPQLFLYSKADHLALCDDVEEHMNDRKAKGVKVFSKCWDNSPHVQHYMKYPEEYLKLLDKFVTVCLNEQK